MGLGLMVAALAIQASSWAGVVKLVLIWLLVLLAGSSVSHLVSRSALHKGVDVWKR